MKNKVTINSQYKIILKHKRLISNELSIYKRRSSELKKRINFETHMYINTHTPLKSLFLLQTHMHTKKHTCMHISKF